MKYSSRINTFKLIDKTLIALFLIATLFLILPTSLLISVEPSRVVHLMKSGNLSGALELYEQHKSENGQHDSELIQSMGFALLEQGKRSSDPETQILSVFGAGISANDKSIAILEEAINSPSPDFQMVAINFLGKFQNDDATELINRAMSSNLFPIRLEALYTLVKNKNPKASGQIEALMQKVVPEVLPVFPQLLAMCGDKSSIKSLQKLLTHPSDIVRTAAINAVAKFERDDLLPELRKLSTHLNVVQQESCAVALGVLKDESSAERLRTLSRSSTVTVKLAALQALYKLGREEVRSDVEKLAKDGDLFAIYMLGDMPGSETTLIELIQSKIINVRTNAALALLKLHHPDCIRALPEIIIRDKRDLVFIKHHSLGGGLLAWKAVPSAKQNFAKNPVGLEVSLHMREEALVEALELPEREFFILANLIFERNQNDLVPVLTQLLTNLQTPNAIQLLKYQREKFGAPLIRNYCNLALFRAKEPGPYAEELRTWISTHHNHGLIQFRPMIPWELRNQKTSLYQLTPEDASRLLVDSIETLVQAQDEHAIDILLNAIGQGNSKNRYALAGLLMRAAN